MRCKEAVYVSRKSVILLVPMLHIFFVNHFFVSFARMTGSFIHLVSLCVAILMFISAAVIQKWIRLEFSSDAQ